MPIKLFLSIGLSRGVVDPWCDLWNIVDLCNNIDLWKQDHTTKSWCENGDQRCRLCQRHRNKHILDQIFIMHFFFTLNNFWHYMYSLQKTSLSLNMITDGDSYNDIVIRIVSPGTASGSDPLRHQWYGDNDSDDATTYKLPRAFYCTKMCEKS